MVVGIGVVLIVVAGMFAGAGISMWAGDIILPAIGLRAPGYWTWFKLSFVLFIGSIVGGFLVGLVKGLITPREVR